MYKKIFAGECNLLALHTQQIADYPFLLESVSTSAHARYSLLFAFPQQKIVLNYLHEFNFCEQLDNAWQTARTVSTTQEACDLPFCGGWFLYLSYELVGQLEPTLRLPLTKTGLPIAVAVRIPAVIIVDHHQQQTVVLAEPDFDAAFTQMLNDVQATLAQTTDIRAYSTAAITVDLREDAPERFTDGVARIKEYIAAGDVFQVNLSRAWYGTVDVSAAHLYRALRKTNPAPFACLADFQDFAIISSSPERLVSVQNQVVETRPIAGTRPRSHDPVHDQALLNELIAHPKERAEHIMLIDLERNDLGRICDYGSVTVNELMVVESYQHVHHIVSNVKGRLRAGVSPGEVIRAVFPGGTITGCPKVRCMEIIAELENTPRGAYTGSVGYLNHNGDLDLNILIRTMTLHNQQLQLRTGAGIVMDSIPNNELQETRHKARGLLRALGHDLD